MRCSVGFVLFVVALAALPLSASAQDAGEGAAPGPKLEEPVNSPEAAAEVPDIETLSQRAIEDFEIRYEIRSEEEKKHQQRRRRGLRIGVPIAVAVVVAAVVGGAVSASIVRGGFD